MNTTEVMRFGSHLGRKDVVVTLHSDRIEWQRTGRWLRPRSRYIMKVPLREISAITLRWAHPAYSVIQITVGGQDFDFKAPHQQAQAVFEFISTVIK